MFQSRISPLRSLAGFELARAFFADCLARADVTREWLFVGYLDRDARLLHLDRHGGDACGVDWPIRAILLEAARRDCAGLVVAHNHPSGDPTPSAADRDSTARLARAGDAIDVTLVDHLLFAGEHCASFRRLGLV